MKYILIGKTGSDISAIRSFLLSEGIVSDTMIPIDALTHKANDSDNVKIIYVKIPYIYHWDCVMLPDYWSQRKLDLFENEIMQFKDIEDDVDIIFEYDGTDYSNLIENIGKWIVSTNCEVTA
jgi:hypothetical protein